MDAQQTQQCNSKNKELDYKRQMRKPVEWNTDFLMVGLDIGGLFQPKWLWFYDSKKWRNSFFTDVLSGLKRDNCGRRHFCPTPSMSHLQPCWNNMQEENKQCWLWERCSWHLPSSQIWRKCPIFQVIFYLCTMGFSTDAGLAQWFSNILLMKAFKRDCEVMVERL